ncbi:MAG: hypothetical protein ACR2RF_00345 [Geminicoccaceae bacterium]
MYAEQAPDNAANVIALESDPGLKLFATAGNGPIRGIHVLAGIPYVVSGTEFYSLSSTGTATKIGGTIPGSNAVCMTANQTQIAIVTNPDAYVFTVGTGLGQITDADFPGASSCTFMDEYGIFSRPDTGQFFISALADMTTYDALDVATAEGAPDDLVAVIAEKRQLILLGEHTGEVWFNSGDATFPFERLPNGFFERGLQSFLAVTKEDNSVFWLGDDGLIYRLEGLTPIRISTHAVEEAIRGYSDKTARAFTYTFGGHKFIVFRFATATWIYDAATDRWHERETYPNKTWVGCCSAMAYGKYLVGDNDNGNIYELDGETYQDNGKTILRLFTFPPVGNGETPQSMGAFEVEFEAGVGLTSGQGSDPQAMLRFSDDGGRTWSNQLTRDIGKIGEYENRAVWNGMGQFRRRVHEVSVSDPVKVAVIDAYGR